MSLMACYLNGSVILESLSSLLTTPTFDCTSLPSSWVCQEPGTHLTRDEREAAFISS